MDFLTIDSELLKTYHDEVKAYDRFTYGDQCEILKFKNIKNIIIPIEQVYVKDVIRKWKRSSYIGLPSNLEKIVDSVKSLEKQLFQFESEYIILIQASGYYTYMNHEDAGAIHIIACFSPSELNIEYFPEVISFYDVIKSYSLSFVTITELILKWQFYKEIKNSLFNQYLLTCGTASCHWPFYGWTH